MVGNDDREVIFPNLRSCMGIACQLSNGHLVGCHVVNHVTKDGVLAEVRSRIAADTGTFVRLDMIADFSKHFVFSKLAFTDKARALGYSGEIFVVDTQPFLKDHSGDAAVARVLSNGNSTPCNLYVVPKKHALPIAYGSVPTSNGVSKIVIYKKVLGVSLVYLFLGTFRSATWRPDRALR